MGFEVTYKYHERQKDGKYNTEEVKELKKKVGNSFEELPLEKLAAVVMSQLARRDIWIIDVEISEFVKKKLNYKESSDGNGIVIKGKKFSFGKSAELIAEDVQVTEVNASTNGTSGPTNKTNALLNHKNKQPKKWMVYDPPMELMQEAQAKGLAFTQGRRYPVFETQEMVTGSVNGAPIYGEVLSTRNDKQVNVVVSDRYFTPVMNLVGDGELLEGGGFNTDVTQRSAKLSYADQLKTDNTTGDVQVPHIPGMPTGQSAPIDTGGIPPELAQMPDIRKGK